MAQNFSVLVVDDEDALRSVLSTELLSEGYVVDTAPDGDDAIAILQQKAFDLVLLDIKMPRVDGFEVLRFIKQRYPNTKVIMLTGFADLKNAIEYCEKAAALGDTLSKRILAEWEKDRKLTPPEKLEPKEKPKIVI